MPETIFRLQQTKSTPNDPLVSFRHIDMRLRKTLTTRTDMLLFLMSQLAPLLTRFLSNTVPALLIVTIFFILGCTPEDIEARLSTDRTSETKDREPTPLESAEQLSPPSLQTAHSPEAPSSDPQALQLLQALIRKYRSATTYSDQGIVQLTYSQAGQLFQDRAELSVVFHRGQSLYCRAYAAQIEIGNGSVLAQLEDPVTNNFDHQTLVRKLENSVFGLSDIYCDPTLTHFSTAGLGGPPPQLELLLSENPFGGLLQGNAAITLAAPQTIDHANCHALVIRSGHLEYRFLIESETMLLRRVELPREAAGLDHSPTITSVELAIDLNQAQWNIPPEAPQHLEGTMQGPRVREFVLPPPAPAPSLGYRPPPFSLSSGTSPFKVSQDGSDRPLTVLLWIVDHPGCRLAAQELQRLADQLTQDVSTPEIRFVLIMAEPNHTLPGRSLALMKQWRVGLPVIDDHDAVGDKVFGITDAPALVVLGSDGLVHWSQQRVGPEMSNTIPNLINDLAAGKSVGEEIRKQYVADQQTYRRLLSEASVGN